MTTSALTIAKASVTAAADLESVRNRLALAKAAHASTAAELASIVAADSAGEADAAPAEVATLRADVGLKAARVDALESNLASASEANRQAGFRLRAETLKADKAILSTGAVDALVEDASKAVAVVLRKLAATLTEGNEANAAALAEAKALNEAGFRIAGIQVSGVTMAPTVAVNDVQLVDFINVTSRLQAVGQDAAAVVVDELLAPARAARAAKDAAEAERDAKYKADLRAAMERNSARIDVSAL